MYTCGRKGSAALRSWAGETARESMAFGHMQRRQDIGAPVGAHAAASVESRDARAAAGVEPASMRSVVEAVVRSGASMKASPPRIAVSCISVSPVWIYRASLSLADSALYSRALFSLSKTCDDSFSGVCASFPLPFCQFLQHFLIAPQLRLLRSVSNFFPGCWTYTAVIIWRKRSCP